GGLVTDASFTGISTQYVVRLPSGRQLTAFAQNTGRATVLPVGCSVTVCWDEAHTFGLDGAEDAAAGIETPDGPAAAARAGLPVGHVAGTGPGGAPAEPEAAPGPRRRRRRPAGTGGCERARGLAARAGSDEGRPVRACEDRPVRGAGVSVTAVAAGTRAAAGPEGAPEEVRRGRRSTPYLLLLPG